MSNDERDRPVSRPARGVPEARMSASASSHGANTRSAAISGRLFRMS